MTDPRPRGRPRAFHDKSAQNTVQSLDRALTILQVLAQGDGRTLTELAQAAGQAAPTVYRVLSTYQAHGFVELDPASQRWHIGAGAFRTGSAFLRRTTLVDRARGPMQWLMRESGETANLGVATKGEVLFLTQIETHEAIRAFFPPGTRSPLHVSGIGKALMAYTPIEQLLDLSTPDLPGFTPASLTDMAALERDLHQTRARGYAIDNEERTEGMRCIAAPVFNTHAEAIAGLSISGPVFRLTLERAEEMGTLVARAALSVTEAIGGRAP
ncbi:MAG: IclR family transcriptional regulator [Rhodobacteraceae bacterium]|nr:IclR family transcriptional regulator [Paracoccaceae bacterium]TVR45282.1 MAG: IclR family transcriptional regulator [Paracoccaceae bacterium]